MNKFASHGACAAIRNPAVYLAKCIVTQGAVLAFIVMREKLGFIGRDIHRHRAVALASLARQAQIERRLHLLVLPLTFDHAPLVISQSRWARPRVECFSSRVTRKLGHITPPSY